MASRRKSNRRPGERGQASTEYMLALSVIVIAVVAAALPFQEQLRRGVDDFSRNFETYFASDDQPGMGF